MWNRPEPVAAAALRAAALDADERAAYLRDGQLTPAWRLPDDLLRRMQAALERLVAVTAPARPDFIPLPHVPPAAGEPERTTLAREFFGFVTHPLLLDLVETVIGPDLVLWAAAVFCKPAATGREVPWHQDGQYWPIRPRATVTVWIALDPVDAGNGCMRVIPGSHRMGEFSHAASDREDLVLNNVLDDPRLDLSTARDIVLEPGQVSLHDVDIVHGSQPNTSGRRAGFAIRYMPSTSLYDRGIDPGQASATVPLEFARRPIWLVRGTIATAATISRSATRSGEAALPDSTEVPTMTTPIILPSVAALAERIADGAKVALFKDCGVPMELGRALVRRRVRDLHIVTVPTGGLLPDMLIGAGCVATVESAGVTLGEFGLAPRFIEAVKQGGIRILDATCPRSTPACRRPRKASCSCAARHPRLGHPEEPPRLQSHRQSLRRERSDRLPARDHAGRRAFHAPLADTHGNVYIGRQAEMKILAHARARPTSPWSTSSSRTCSKIRCAPPRPSTTSTSAALQRRPTAPCRSTSPAITTTTPRRCATTPQPRRPRPASTPGSNATC